MKLDLIPVWVKALVIGALVGLLAFKLYDAGVQHERANWKAKENAEIIALKTQALNLGKENRALERQHLLDAKTRDEQTTQELQHAKDRETKLLNDVRTGALRLSVATKAVQACASGVSTIATSEQNSNTETRAELSDAVAKDILTLGSDADQVTIERNALADEVLACRAQYQRMSALCSHSEFVQKD